MRHKINRDQSRIRGNSQSHSIPVLSFNVLLSIVLRLIPGGISKLCVMCGSSGAKTLVPAAYPMRVYSLCPRPCPCHARPDSTYNVSPFVGQVRSSSSIWDRWNHVLNLYRSLLIVITQNQLPHKNHSSTRPVYSTITPHLLFLLQLLLAVAPSSLHFVEHSSCVPARSSRSSSTDITIDR